MTTIYDIAKKVGCAPSTVSKYLTKHGHVSQQLGKQIGQAMQELDFHYNGMAAHLSKNINNRIGVMVPFFDHPYFQALTNAISIAAAKVGKEVVLMPTSYRPSKERYYLNELEHRLVNSLIITSHHLPYEEIAPYQRFGNLVFCEDLDDSAIRTVRTNRLAVLKELFQALKDQGYLRLGFLLIRPPKESRSTREIFQAYRAIYGYQVSRENVCYHCRNLVDGRQAVQKLLPLKVDAVLTEGDATAAGAYQVIHEVGQSTMVIGQGNQLPSQLLNFTSIDQRYQQMGQTAVDLALGKVPLADEIKFKIIWRTGLTGNRFPDL